MARKRIGHLVGDLLDLFLRAAEDLGGELRAHTGGQHIDAVDDRLGPDVGPTDLPNRFIQFANQVGFGLGQRKAWAPKSWARSAACGTAALGCDS